MLCPMYTKLERETMKTIKLSAKDLFLINNALEIINPDDSRDEARARELAPQFYSLEANTEYALTVQPGKDNR